MQDLLDRMAARITGPMNFRFILQPIAAILLGIRDGKLDAKAGTPPFIYDVIFKPEDRRKQLKNALHSLLKPVIIGILLDAIAQYFIFKDIKVLEAFIVGTLIMGVPYAFSRAFTNRIVTLMKK